jgi:hypothetical protein
MVKGPLLRMDLLERKDGPLAGAKRDPFIPGAFAPPMNESPRPGAKISFPTAGAGGRPETAPEAEGAAPEPVVNVRYIGFIQGKEKFLALVLFNGQATAVSAGEALGNVWKVVRAGATEIEIQGPDGSALKFALEGERK